MAMKVPEEVTRKVFIGRVSCRKVGKRWWAVITAREPWGWFVSGVDKWRRRTYEAETERAAYYSSFYGGIVVGCFFFFCEDLHGVSWERVVAIEVSCASGVPLLSRKQFAKA